jgi:hypothetical protein
MSGENKIRPYLIFTGTGPILVLSTYGDLADDRLLSKLRYKGIEKFIAYEVELDAVRERYSHTFKTIAQDLEDEEDLRVLDFNGHQIMANFALSELGEAMKYGD